MNTQQSGNSSTGSKRLLEQFLESGETPGPWADWVHSLAVSGKVGDSGQVILHAERLAQACAISTEAATGLLLWLGSVCMIQHANVRWPSGIWEPAGLTIALVEEDGVPIDAITNAFIKVSQNLGIDPIHDTVKEGPAGLIARLESAGHRPRKVESGPLTGGLSALAEFDTTDLAEPENRALGSSRALIYPSGRALLSYLYDVPFFNTLDELIQHGNLSLRGKQSSHRIKEVHLSTIVPFYQGALVTLTHDSRVQSNMHALMRQMLVFWPTSGTRRYTKRGRIDIALYDIEQQAKEGLDLLESLNDKSIDIPVMPAELNDSLIHHGPGVRYTVLNRQQRIAKLAIGVAFWRIAKSGTFEILQSDLAMAESILHMHEMGGRLLELVMSKGKLGHEFMRIFVSMLRGEEVSEAAIAAEELSHASELNIGSSALQRLNDLCITSTANMLNDDYRFVTGNIIRKHSKRWKL